MKLVIKRRIIKHFFVWCLLTIYFSLIDPIEGTFWGKTLATFLIMFRYAFFYYFELFIIFPKFYKKKLILTLLMCCSFFCYFLFFHLTYEAILSKNIVKSMFEGQSIHSILISNLIIFGIISIMALGAYQNKLAILTIKMQAEKEKNLIIKEIEFLKNQFNSEVTFNFLNYCYDEIKNFSQETAEVVKIFIRILNYSLKNKANETVLLEREIDYIEDYISIQKLLDKSVKVNFSQKITKNELYSIKIFPRVLITFVENAFKHGNLYSVENPINIKLFSSVDYVEFEITNEKNTQKIKEPSGIGYLNLKQQLELHYENRYTLEVVENDTSYYIYLKLFIKF